PVPPARRLPGRSRRSSTCATRNGRRTACKCFARSKSSLTRWGCACGEPGKTARGDHRNGGGPGMRTVIILGVMGVVLFGLASGASTFLTTPLKDRARGPHGAPTTAEGTGREKDLPPPLTRGSDAPRTRPGSSSDTEQLVREWAQLHEREDAVAKKEQQL